MREIQEQLSKEKGKAEARQKVEEFTKKLGYAVEELFGMNEDAKEKTRKYVKKKPMYVDPDDKRRSWVGPSRKKPQWVKDYEAAGGNIEDFRVQD